MRFDNGRRQALKTLGYGAIGAAAAPYIKPARAATKLRVGYLHTLAVDGQIWLGDHMGTWADQGLEMEYTKFTTGLGLFQALVGGSLDVLATGAVVSNFPARGQGEVFLINNVEWATAQLWVNPDMGVSSFADLKGKKIATTKGTTAHVFLHKALKANGLDPDNDVQLVNQRMSEAVTSFIAEAVSAVALWVPFNVQVEEKLANAKKLDDASSYYPEAAIVGGWAARGDFYRNNPEVIDKIIRGWIPANDFLVNNSEEALNVLQKNYYQNVPLSQLQNQFKAEKVFTSDAWAEKYQDGTVTKWLNQVTGFFEEIGAVPDPVPAEKYFHKDRYLNIVTS